MKLDGTKKGFAVGCVVGCLAMFGIAANRSESSAAPKYSLVQTGYGVLAIDYEKNVAYAYKNTGNRMEHPLRLAARISLAQIGQPEIRAEVVADESQSKTPSPDMPQPVAPATQ